MEEAPDPEGATWVELPVSDEFDGARADKVVTQNIPEIGRKLASHLFDRGDVLVDGRRAKKGQVVIAGNLIRVRSSAWGRAAPAPEVPCTIVLETPQLVICDKPAGIPSGALVGRESGTMAGALLARYPEMERVGYGPREPGIVHRLDTMTSGLLLAARTPEAFDSLRAALSGGRIEKRYLALVRTGVLDEKGTIETCLAPDPRDARRVAVVAQGGYPATTRYRTLRRGSAFDLVEASASPAYRHQIRAQFCSLGAPLAGDEVYGAAPAFAGERHALHACYIAGAAKGVPAFEAESELPPDWSALLDG